MSTNTVEYVAPDGQQFELSGPPEDGGTTGTAEPELSWGEEMARSIKAMEATALAKQSLAPKPDEEEDEVDPDKMQVVPNRQAMRDAYNQRGAVQLGRSRIRRRIHRVLVKRGTWK